MKILLGVVVMVALVVGLLFMQGVFDPGKVGPDTKVQAPERAGERRTAGVERVRLPVYAEAVGTVRSRRTTRVSPRIMGTILDLTVEPGDEVSPGDVLAHLDVREAEARLAAARAAVSQAEAVFLRASADYRRYTELLEKGATTRERVEGATADYESAKAALDGAKEQVKAADIVVGYAEITAPVAGVVATKLAEPGDLALPGKPLLVLQDPADLRLEAEVREYLVTNVEVGAAVEIVFGPPLDERWETKVEERATEADPATRTFTVKAPLPKATHAKPGNFGRLRFRAGERDVLLVPPEAVRRVGQLEKVRVVEDGRVRVRHVRTGESREGRLEVLSGLSAGETVVVE